MPDRNVDALREVPLFSGLEPKALKQLAAMLEERTYAAGEQVTAEGSRDGAGIFFLLDAGGAEVRRGGEIVGTLGPGDCFGELALITKGPRTATVTATSELRCRTLASFQLRALAKQHGDIAWSLLEEVVARLRTQPE